VKAVAVVLLGFVALLLAVAVPDLHDAVQRGRQKRAMSDLRSIGTAVESYAVDHGFHPSASSIVELALVVEPEYIRQLPRADGWGTSYRFESWSVRDGFLVPGGATDYAVRSAGSDGAWDHDLVWDYQPGSFRSFEQDIVFGCSGPG
jgi:type II secretory pathway pseudopilin PulG